MLHLLLDKQPWFEARGGLLCARPVRWQAHLLVANFLLALIGVEVLMARDAVSTGGAVALILGVTAVFIAIVIKRTARLAR